MIRAIIIEDEESSIDILSRLITDHFRDVKLIGNFNNVSDAVSGIKILRPDLVFLDVQLGDDTGFSVLSQVDPTDFHTIFVTAFDMYAVQAFKYSAIDYLMKPIDIEDLYRALDKVAEKISVADMKKKFEILFHNIQNINTATKKICLPDTNGTIFLLVKEIVRCESSRNYTYIFLENGNKILISKTLKEVENLLNDAGFFRVHHSYLINMHHAKRSKTRNRSVRMVEFI